MDEPFPPYQDHSDTSYGAAEAIAGSRANSLRRQLYRFLRTRGPQGATDEEAQEFLQMAQNTQRPRRIELCRHGIVEDSGQRRRTHSGRWAVVWVTKANWTPPTWWRPNLTGQA